MVNFDLIIIGGGPAGYHAALKAAKNGMKVALFEEKRLGGTCLNEGCIPSKALLHTAKVFEYGKNGAKYGVTIENIGINHAAAISRKNRIVKALTMSIADSEKKAGVEVILEKAYINGIENGLFSVGSQDNSIKSKKLLICTGSESAFPPISGMDEALRSGFAISSTEILSLDEVPENLLILGGGIIGLEMAQYYALAGSQVKVIEMLDHIGGEMDPELSQILKRELEQKGIEFFLNTRAKEIKEGVLEAETESGTIFIEGDKLLVSTGRKPRIKGMGFENIGLDISKDRIFANENMETEIPGVFAAGDCNGKSLLAHTAYREAEIAVENILGNKEAMDYSAIPSVIYTNPEVAWVGESEESLINQEKSFEAIKLPMMISGRYAAEGGTPRGIIKTFKDKETGKLLGVHAIGNGSSEFIFGAALVMSNGLTAQQAGKTVFPHPTIGEVLRDSFNG